MSALARLARFARLARLARLALVAAVAAAWAAGARVDFDALPRPAAQPRRAAFGIWGLLFPALLAAAVAAPRAALPPRAAWALVASLALDVAWAEAMRAGAYEAALAALAAATAAAWRARAAAPRGAARGAVGLYAGWLAVAAALMLALVETARRPGGAARRLLDDPRAVLAGPALLALAADDPAPGLSVLWAAWHAP